MSHNKTEVIMIKLGKMQTLTAVKRTENGLYLKDYSDDSSKSILLPNNDISDEEVGDDFDVFVYKDSKDRVIATTTIPYITLGKFAALTVTDITPIGAFLDWGLQKDLLLPFKEQTKEQRENLCEGDKVYVSLYIDKSNRLCATAKVYDLLRCDSPYVRNDIVNGTVFGINPKLGAFIAVDDMFNSLLPAQRIITPLKIGDVVSAYVNKVRDDGKLTLALTESSYIQMDSDASFILDELKENDGFLPFNDKSDSDSIKSRFSMSKNSFKRAIGRLYKERKITIEDDGIHIV